MNVIYQEISWSTFSLMPGWTLWKEGIIATTFYLYLCRYHRHCDIFLKFRLPITKLYIIIEAKVYLAYDKIEFILHTWRNQNTIQWLRTQMSLPVDPDSIDSWLCHLENYCLFNLQFLYKTGKIIFISKFLKKIKWISIYNELVYIRRFYNRVWNVAKPLWMVGLLLFVSGVTLSYARFLEITIKNTS